MATRNKSEFRQVNITYGVGGSNMPIDAYQAIIERVRVLEAAVERGSQPDNLASAITAIVGLNRYQTHIFELTTNFAVGSYIFSYLETVPTVDDSISINE